MQYIAAIREDWWVCLCGNTPCQAGFYPCDLDGVQVEPTPAEWTTDCYVCDQCGRIIRQADRRVVGVRATHTLTTEEREAIVADVSRFFTVPRPATDVERTMLVDWVQEQARGASQGAIETHVNAQAYIAVFEQDLARLPFLSRYHGWVMSVVWENGPTQSDLFVRKENKLTCIESLPINMAHW